MRGGKKLTSECLGSVLVSSTCPSTDIVFVMVVKFNFFKGYQFFSPSFTNSMKRDRRTFESESYDSSSDVEESLTPNSQQHLMDYGDSQSRNDYTEYCDKCFKEIREFYYDDPGLDTENKAFRCFSCSELLCPKHVVLCFECEEPYCGACKEDIISVDPEGYWCNNCAVICAGCDTPLVEYDSQSNKCVFYERDKRDCEIRCYYCICDVDADSDDEVCEGCGGHVCSKHSELYHPCVDCGAFMCNKCAGKPMRKTLCCRRYLCRPNVFKSCKCKCESILVEARLANQSKFFANLQQTRFVGDCTIYF